MKNLFFLILLMFTTAAFADFTVNCKKAAPDSNAGPSDGWLFDEIQFTYNDILLLKMKARNGTEEYGAEVDAYLIDDSYDWYQYQGLDTSALYANFRNKPEVATISIDENLLSGGPGYYSTQARYYAYRSLTPGRAETIRYTCKQI